MTKKRKGFSPLAPGEFRIMDRTPRWSVQILSVKDGVLTYEWQRLPDLSDYVFRNDPDPTCAERVRRDQDGAQRRPRVKKKRKRRR